MIARIATPFVLRKLQELNLPVVNVSGVQVEGCEYPRVMTSPQAEANLAYEAFRSRGIRQFAYVGNTDEVYVKSHCKTYRELLARHGHQLTVHKPTSIEALQSWLRDLHKPIGIFCWGTHWGNRVINACAHEGISVPHDVAVLGSNYDEVFSEASSPPQAGIMMNPKHIGEVAASVLNRLMNKQPIDRKEWLLEPVKVVERQSIDTLAVADSRICAVLKYLEKNATRPITVDDVVSAVPAPRRTLERRFREHIGCSIGEHIRRLRINRARELLANTNQTMVAISDACGFSSYNYFNRVFKQVVGVAPSRYRKEWQSLILKHR